MNDLQKLKIYRAWGVFAICWWILFLASAVTNSMELITITGLFFYAGFAPLAYSAVMLIKEKRKSTKE